MSAALYMFEVERGQRQGQPVGGEGHYFGITGEGAEALCVAVLKQKGWASPAVTVSIRDLRGIPRCEHSAP